jgi:hypothetical protein
MVEASTAGSIKQGSDVGGCFCRSPPYKTAVMNYLNSPFPYKSLLNTIIAAVHLTILHDQYTKFTISPKDKVLIGVWTVDSMEILALLNHPLTVVFTPLDCEQ